MRQIINADNAFSLFCFLSPTEFLTVRYMLMGKFWDPTCDTDLRQSKTDNNGSMELWKQVKVKNDISN
ncbi:uncharacterized protein DS421_3g97200 [Arachis hypogaea]|nr:uncharacterized protein DS421_3g97200 [Arachis hypogaea]